MLLGAGNLWIANERGGKGREKKLSSAKKLTRRSFAADDKSDLINKANLEAGNGHAPAWGTAPYGASTSAQQSAVVHTAHRSSYFK